MYTAHTNPLTCSIESDYLPLHHLTNCDPGDPSSLMTVLETEGYTDIKYLGGGYFTFNSLTFPAQPVTVETTKTNGVTHENQSVLSNQVHPDNSSPLSSDILQEIERSM